MIALYRSMVEDLLLSLHYRSSLHRSVQAIAFGVLAIPLTLAVHRFDRRISTRGLSRAASALLRHYYSGLVSDPALRVFLQAAESRRNAAGAGRIFTANHPGVGDGLACLAVIGSKNLPDTGTPKENCSISCRASAGIALLSTVTEGRISPASGKPSAGFPQAGTS
jgi:hypothetical protein